MGLQIHNTPRDHTRLPPWTVAARQLELTQQAVLPTYLKRRRKPPFELSNCNPSTNKQPSNLTPSSQLGYTALVNIRYLYHPKLQVISTEQVTYRLSSPCRKALSSSRRRTSPRMPTSSFQRRRRLQRCEKLLQLRSRPHTDQP